MRGMRHGLNVIVVGVVLCWAGSVSAAGPTAAQKCEVAKLGVVVKKEACLAAERAKEVLGGTPNFTKCSTRFEADFAKIEARVGMCPGTADAIEGLVDACFEDLKDALAGSPPAPCQQFPATGQTTCWNSAGAVIPCAGTGQDGDIQAGGTLSYTDNGDGTITDNNTKLVWEKKTFDGSIHDMDNIYTWADAFAIHVAGLNAANFAGHNDWRLPNVKELLSIIDYQNFNPAVASAFQNASCVPGASVLTASCTRGDFYWSSTTAANNPNFAPTFAYFVNFLSGFVFVEPKSGINSSRRVRAVRGGANLGSSQ